MLLGLLSAGFLDALPAPARFLLAFSVLSWIPGAILVGRVLRLAASGPVEKTVLWFAAGLAALSLLTWPAKIAGVSFSAYGVLIQWALAVFFGVAVVLDARRRATGRDGSNDPEATALTLRRPLQYGLVSVAVVLALLALLQPPRFSYQQDSLDHIGYVRHIGSENSLSPDGVLAQPKDTDGVRVKEDPRKGTLQPVVALAARMSAVDPIEAWRTLPALFFPLAFLAFAWFCAVFLPRQRLVLGCAALFLLFQGGTGVLHGLEFANGQGVWLVFYWTLVPLCLRYVASDSARDLWAVLAVFAGAALMHVGVVTHVAVLLATLLLFHRWLRLGLGAVVRLCVGAGIIAVVVLAWKISTSIGQGNEIHLHPQGLFYITERMFVASPVELLRQNGLVFFGGMVLVPFLLFAARNHISVRFQLSFAVVPFLVCFFPPLVPVLYDHAAYMVFRAILNVPAFATVATAVYLLVVWSRRRGMVTRVAAAAILLVWFKLFFVPAVAALERSSAERNAWRDSLPLFDRYGDLIDYLGKRPGGTVVLSDPATSYMLSAATNHRFVAVLDQHGNPNDAYGYDRLAAVRDVLSPFLYLSMAVEGCERFGVDVIVVNGRLRGDPPGLLVDWSPSLYEQARTRLDALGQKFVKMYEADDVSVYFYNRGPAPKNRWIPEVTPPVFGLENLQNCTIRAPDDAFFVDKVGVRPERVLPGETLEISLGYQMSQPVPYGLPYVIHIRFDHHTIAHEGEGSFFDKQTRRFRERRGGYLYRYRVDHHPFGDVFPVSQWPTALLFYETFPVTIPPSLKPGTYVVEISIERESLLPNFVLRDFFYNRDHYSGTECLTIEVTRQLVR